MRVEKKGGGNALTHATGLRVRAGRSANAEERQPALPRTMKARKANTLALKLWGQVAGSRAKTRAGRMREGGGKNRERVSEGRAAVEEREAAIVVKDGGVE